MRRPFYSAVVVVLLILGCAVAIPSLQFTERGWNPGLWFPAALAFFFLAYFAAALAPSK